MANLRQGRCDRRIERFLGISEKGGVSEIPASAPMPPAPIEKLCRVAEDRRSRDRDRAGHRRPSNCPSPTFVLGRLDGVKAVFDTDMQLIRATPRFLRASGFSISVIPNNSPKNARLTHILWRCNLHMIELGNKAVFAAIHIVLSWLYSCT